MQDLAARVGELLRAQGMMLATAESCTGGGVAAAATEIPGSSAWFERGFVTYSNDSKVELLGVRPATLEAHGAVSELTVREMAEGALRQSKAQIALAVSGIAGPGGGSITKPVGTVWLAWSLRDGPTRAQLHYLQGSRSEIRRQTVRLALQGVADCLQQPRGLA